ncbi:hypothetical protein [Paractinoplanes toevensis]|uniref:Uncharacterized protein n=1 Tax=Paractinoplanes toevensis TaxID=571911 RepID=A0A919T6L8_9ACTN|nr:hypothetical protein [Actinoplanes toevensis]GIM90113.1 hypothetical protein Ato02nite_019060 [Actinoplanes toevensis]
MTIDHDVGTSITVDQAGSLLYSLISVSTFALAILIILRFAVHRSGLVEEVTAWVGRRRTNRILIVVELPVEATAMRAATAGQRKPRFWRQRHGVEYLATYSRARLYLKVAEPGDTVHDAVRCLSRARPDLVLLAGLCRGLHPERQGVGDIVLCHRGVSVVPANSVPAKVSASEVCPWRQDDRSEPQIQAGEDVAGRVGFEIEFAEATGSRCRTGGLWCRIDLPQLAACAG